MSDVAAAAGVSVGTVSRALRGMPGVSAETRARILDLADRMDYVLTPDFAIPAHRVTRRVVIAMSSLRPWGAGEVLDQLVPVLTDHGVEVLVYQIDNAERRSRFFARLPTWRTADVLVVAGLVIRPDEAERLARLDVQVLLVGQEHPSFWYVALDERAAAVAAINHLVDLGHRRICVVADATDTSGSPPRHVRFVRNCREVLADHGIPLPDDLAIRVPPGPQHAVRAVRALVEKAEPPTAVLASNDQLAGRVADELARRGMNVPADISVMGIGGHPLSAFLGLTTVDQRRTEQGERAAAIVIDAMEGAAPSQPTVRIPVRLVVRQSTGSH